MSCRGEFSPPAEKGRWGVSVGGYLMKRIKKVLYYQHRIVMEKHLGRSLSTDEHIHHIDGDRVNNEIGNLLLTTNSEHRKLHIREHAAARRLA